MMVSGGGAFGNRLGCESGVLMTGINVLVKEAWENSPAPSAMRGHSQKITIYKLGHWFS